MTRKPYPRGVSEEEWSFVVPYLTLMNEQAPQRQHDLRGIFNGLRWLVREQERCDGCYPMTYRRGNSQ
jgi:transposase